MIVPLGFGLFIGLVVGAVFGRGMRRDAELEYRVRLDDAQAELKRLGLVMEQRRQELVEAEQQTRDLLADLRKLDDRLRAGVLLPVAERAVLDILARHEQRLEQVRAEAAARVAEAAVSGWRRAEAEQGGTS